jgi:hypothetical protein
MGRYGAIYRQMSTFERRFLIHLMGLSVYTAYEFYAKEKYRVFIWGSER